jgi:hypothetical protein
VIGGEAAARTSGVPVRCKHQMEHEELCAAREQLSETFRAFAGVELKLLLDGNPRQRAALARQLVTVMCELLLLGEQLDSGPSGAQPTPRTRRDVPAVSRRR